MTTFTIGAALIVGAAACATDLHSRRIPNWLTFGSTAAAIAYQYATAGQAGVQHAMGGWVVGLVLFMPLFLLNGMGAGDVKLLAALGAWLGPGHATLLAIYSSMAGGLIAVPLAIRHRYLGTAFKNLGALAKFWWICGLRPLRRVSLDGGTGPRLAYAVPVFLGMVLTLWLH
jgi:prepilin peptidase CpaA